MPGNTIEMDEDEVKKILLSAFLHLRLAESLLAEAQHEIRDASRELEDFIKKSFDFPKLPYSSPGAKRSP